MHSFQYLNYYFVLLYGFYCLFLVYKRATFHLHIPPSLDCFLIVENPNDVICVSWLSFSGSKKSRGFTSLLAKSTHYVGPIMALVLTGWAEN
jgi:hypothetical protein